MLYLLGVVGLVLALLISVTLHEAGHFLTARKFGMKASRFFVGFGPTLWSFRRGETEYGVKAIPAGGFVKIEGMTDLEEVAPGDENRAFWRFPAGQRAVVLAAGSVMHFILAIVLVYGVTLAIGKADPDAPVVGSVAECVPKTPDDESTCDVDDAIPAPAAGKLLADDRFIAVNGKPVDGWEDVVLEIRASAGQNVDFTVERDGEPLTVTMEPVRVERFSIDDPEKTERVGAIGVTPGLAFEGVGPVEGIGETFGAIGEMLAATGRVFTDKLETITTVYSDERDPEGFTGVVGVSRVSGEILSLQDEPMSVRIGNFLFIVAGVNLFVGIFNLFPLLPLDGGHLGILGFEQTRHRLERRRRARELARLGASPEVVRTRVAELPVRRVDLNKLLPLTYAVVILMIGLTVFIAGADIVNPIRLTQ